jgi:hypothetical protein
MRVTVPSADAGTANMVPASRAAANGSLRIVSFMEFSLVKQREPGRGPKATNGIKPGHERYMTSILRVRENVRTAAALAAARFPRRNQLPHVFDASSPA